MEGVNDPAGNLRAIRARRPPPYPDQAVYLEAACGHYGVPFDRLDASGTVVVVGPTERSCALATTGRTCVYPLNTASAMALATDKFFTRLCLDARRVPNLGGDFFFLESRLRGLRSEGHELSNARDHMATRGFVAFCKPLAGSRGDFAERIRGQAAFEEWLSRVGAVHDAILVQDIVDGDEFRVMVLDDAPFFGMQRGAPALRGDGVRTVNELFAALLKSQSDAGISASRLPERLLTDTDRAVARHDVLSHREAIVLNDRRNVSAGAPVRLLEGVQLPEAVSRLAVAACRALGLRVAGVDVMVAVDGPRVIEVNGNPAIGSLERLGREDLIVRLWGEIFQRMGWVRDA